ncbi:hypothetical protein ACOCJ7_08325 [Knoellia sp. CPCC 206453]|uniref:hypothetical protein n=1 Tax=Knoellia pratensis TaxID=3404796 RepID=UPI00361616C6
MNRLLTAVRLPATPSVADLLVVEIIGASAKDLEIDSARVHDEGKASAVLCIGTLPDLSAPSPLLVRGSRPVPGEDGIRGLQVCTDASPRMSSSAGYASGMQHVGNFLPPIARTPARTGPLDLTAQWFVDPDAVGEHHVLALLGAATEVTTYAASPVVSVALALGLTVHVDEGPDTGWDVLPEHLDLADSAEVLGHVRQTFTPLTARDKADAGAGPRVARLLRQAAYLPF